MTQVLRGESGKVHLGPNHDPFSSPHGQWGATADAMGVEGASCDQTNGTAGLRGMARLERGGRAAPWAELRRLSGRREATAPSLCALPGGAASVWARGW